MSLQDKISIRVQLLVLAVFTIFATLAVVYIMYSRTASMTMLKNSDYTSGVFDQIKHNVDSNCEILSNLLAGLAYNGTLQEYALETDDVKRYELMRSVRTLFISARKINRGILDIAFLGREDTRFDIAGTSRFLRDTSKEVPNRVEWFFTGIKTLNVGGKEKECILAAAPVYSIIGKNTGQRIGTLYIVLDKQVFSYRSDAAAGDTSNMLYLLDREGVVFSTNDPHQENRRFDLLNIGLIHGNAPFSAMIGGRKSIVHIRKLNAIGGSIVGIVAEEELLAGIVDARSEGIKAFLIALLLLAVPFLLLIRNIVTPIRKLTVFMASVGSGNLKNLSQRVKLHGHAEIAFMAEEFNRMLDEIHSLTHRLVDTSSMLYEAELEKRKSQMSFLQSQINPHFIYNTLEAVKGIAASRGVTEIRDMTRALAQIMYYSIKGEDTVALREEVKIAASYFTIQRIRFNNRFEVFMEFDEEILDCRMPKMILQPVVENAVYHGLEPKLGEGCLWMGGAVDENEDLNLWIRDNGVGMNAEILAGLNRSLQADPISTRSKDEDSYHIGLANVNKRLKLAYGSEYGLQINSEPGRGTMVVMKIPVRRVDHA